LYPRKRKQIADHATKSSPTSTRRILLHLSRRLTHQNYCCLAVGQHCSQTSRCDAVQVGGCKQPCHLVKERSACNSIMRRPAHFWLAEKTEPPRIAHTLQKLWQMLVQPAQATVSLFLQARIAATPATCEDQTCCQATLSH
jgi:hypothetical protein